MGVGPLGLCPLVDRAIYFFGELIMRWGALSSWVHQPRCIVAWLGRQSRRFRRDKRNIDDLSQVGVCHLPSAEVEAGTDNYVKPLLALPVARR